jgi:type VI secretion system protein ImpC
MIAEIDRKLSEQLNQIIHHEDFKALEGTWRGLHHLVQNTETDETLKIRVFNISKKDLAKNLRQYKGVNWDQSPLFKKIYEEEFGTPGGSPFGCLVGDYQFDHTAGDVELLTGISKIAAAAHAPFLSAAAPSLMGMSSWQELSDPRDLTKILNTVEYAAWKSLRSSEDAKYLALTMPRFLARTPYGAKTSPVEEFAFEEDVEGGDHSKYVWSNAAYAMAANITRSFKQFGWCASIRGSESGGRVENLPTHSFPTDDGGVDMKCPTEISITDRREAELAKNGLMPLSHWKNTDYAMFVGAQSLQKPAEYENPEHTANARLAARLPYLFATCRFAHYLKCIVRDKVGSFKSREDMHDMLHDWIVRNYVTTDDRADETTKAEKPLREARVEVEEVPGSPGYYSAKFWLRPHFQLEGLSVSLRLVSKLPSGKANN